MKKSKVLQLFMLLVIISGTAFQHNENKQINGDESLVITSQKLDANNISTWFATNGMFNHNPVNPANAGFEWPKGSGKFARFASGLWLGARVGNDTLVAITSYGSEYLNGYTDNNGVPQGENNPVYRIYRLTYGINDQDRANWPNALLGNSNQGAPVYFDNLTNSWKPLDFGHQTLFYRYTDSYPQSHTLQNGSTAPLKADVMKVDFSLNAPGGLDDVVFSQFTIINKSNNTWNDAFITIWTDDDLGYAADDKVGCDSALNLGYTYNSTNNDPQYGNAPPAVGFLFLRGALKFTGNNNDTVFICRNKTRIPLIGYKDLKMSGFNWFGNTNDPQNGNPSNFRESFRYMSGFRRNGQPIVHPLGYITKYMFSGDPVTNTGWNQTGSGDDQRSILSTGPVNMAPGDTQVIVIAQPIARGTSNLNSITKLRELCALVKNYYNSCYTAPAIGIEPISNEVPGEFKLYQNYPNPFNPVTTIRFEIPLWRGVDADGGRGVLTKLIIYDALGREVTTLVNEKLSPGAYEINWPACRSCGAGRDASDYPSGVYFYKLIAGDYSETKKMVLVK
ncbi:MAG TPA: T9SS type A sorting domain-containing protein [Ignavibacteria bacterium]|jgi:hypothetical protein